MNTNPYTLKKAAAIVRGIPLLEKKFVGWKTLYDSYVEKEPGAHPEVAKLLREALPMAEEALLLARSVEAILPYADENTLAGMVCYAGCKHHQLDLLAGATYQAIKGEKSPLCGLPEEYSDSDVVRYWQKRYRLKITIYRTTPHDN